MTTKGRYRSKSSLAILSPIDEFDFTRLDGVVGLVTKCISFSCVYRRSVRSVDDCRFAAARHGRPGAQHYHCYELVAAFAANAPRKSFAR